MIAPFVGTVLLYHTWLLYFKTKVQEACSKAESSPFIQKLSKYKWTLKPNIQALLYFSYIVLFSIIPVITYFFDEWSEGDEEKRTNPNLYVYNRCVKRSDPYLLLAHMIVISAAASYFYLPLRNVQDTFKFKIELTLALFGNSPTLPICFASLITGAFPSYLSYFFWTTVNFLPLLYVTTLFPVYLTFGREFTAATKGMNRGQSSQLETVDESLLSRVLENPLLFNRFKQ